MMGSYQYIMKREYDLDYRTQYGRYQTGRLYYDVVLKEEKVAEKSQGTPEEIAIKKAILQSF
jgi:hypothetical protein